MTKKQTQQVSKCCGTGVHSSRPNATRGQTVYYICDKCNEPCDAIEYSRFKNKQQKESEDWESTLSKLIDSLIITMKLGGDVPLRRELIRRLVRQQIKQAFEDGYNYKTYQYIHENNGLPNAAMKNHYNQLKSKYLNDEEDNISEK